MSRKPASDQYVLDFQSRRNDLYALINGVQALPDTVRDLLKRLIAITPSGTALDGETIVVRGSVEYLGGKMIGFRSVTGRTIQAWRALAESLGVLSVEFARGYRQWNVWTIRIEAIKQLLQLHPTSPISSPIFTHLHPNALMQGDAKFRDVVCDDANYAEPHIEEESPLEEPQPQTISLEIEMTKQTWMTPYAEVWLAVFGGRLACGRSAKALKQLQEEHGAIETIRRWQIYCDAHKGRGAYANAEKFSQTFGEWKASPEKSRRVDRPDSDHRPEVYDPKKHGPWNPITGLEDNGVYHERELCRVG